MMWTALGQIYDFSGRAGHGRVGREEHQQGRDEDNNHHTRGLIIQYKRCYESIFYWIRICIRNQHKTEEMAPDLDQRPES